MREFHIPEGGEGELSKIIVTRASESEETSLGRSDNERNESSNDREEKRKNATG